MTADGQNAAPVNAPASLAAFEVEPGDAAVLREALPGVTVRATLEALGLKNAAHARDAQLLAIRVCSHIDAALLDLLPAVRLVTTLSTGYDHIDLNCCRDRGVVVCNVPTYGEATVAEHTFGLILSLSRKIHQAAMRTARGDFSLAGLRGFDLRGRTMGVIGTGHIGLHVVRIARGFGMEVIAHNPRDEPFLADVLGFRYAPLDEVLAAADVITLHVPLTPETHHLINRDRLAGVKRGALLINTARGAVVDTSALLWALDEGILAGAGLDVLEGEQLIGEEEHLLGGGNDEQLRAVIAEYALLRRDNVLVTPHLAWDSTDALRRILDTTAANVRAFLAGNPINVVPA